jgi:hypothetical protein
MVGIRRRQLSRREISALIRAARERMSDEELREDLTERARALGFEPPPETQH